MTQLLTFSGILTVVDAAFAGLNGCIKAIAFIAAARHSAQDARRVGFMLEYEEFRLLQWAERVGFSEEQPDPTTINWILAQEVLENLQHDLTNARILKEKYNLEDSHAGDHLDGPNVSGDSHTASLARLRAHASRSMTKIRKRAIDRGVMTYQSLKWAALDQEKIRALIDHIHYTNDCLRDLLDSARQDFVFGAISELHRDLISRSSTNLDLDVVGALLDTESSLSDAALEPTIRVKYTRLMASIDKREDEKWISQPQKTSLSRVKYENLLSIASSDRDNWNTAVYKISAARRTIHSHVFLEWKTVPKTIESKLAKRIQELTFLLSTASAGFQTLRCLGYVVHEMEGDANKYAYVFEITDLLQNPDSILPKPITLRTFFARNPLHSLNKRFAIALTIAESVLQLHTAGWLHKNISSTSLLFLSWPDNDLPSKASIPYLCGFEFTRNNVEDSEAVTLDTDGELYHHPDYQAGGLNHEPGFRKTYDLYSLGCVLLEVALWTSFEAILYSIGLGSAAETMDTRASEKSAGQLAHERRLLVLKGRNCLLQKESMNSITERVAFHAGDCMRQAIELCFFPLQRDALAASGLEREEVADNDYLEVSVDTQIRIVNLIRSARRL